MVSLKHSCLWISLFFFLYYCNVWIKCSTLFFLISQKAHWWLRQFVKWTTPFKKSNATQVWSIIFLLSWICVNQVRYPWKACLFAFRLMPYLLGLFHWGMCRVSKLRAMSKRKICKIDRILWNMHAMSCFVLSFCERTCTRTCCPFHCTEILWNKTSCWISNSGAILEHLYFDIASN